MKTTWQALTLLLWTASALAGTSAQLLRPTELKDKPFNDAATIAKLDAKAMVTVLARQGAWTQVQAAQPPSGWLRMFNLRAVGQGNIDDSAVGKAMMKYLTGATDSTATTGIKGLTEVDLRDAQPDASELARMAGFGASRTEAEAFAHAAGLTSRQMDYLPAPK